MSRSSLWFKRVELLENCEDMVHVAAVGVFDTKIVYHDTKGDVAGGVCPQAGCMCAWCVYVCGQVGYELIVC
jgi:hypothetical protein